MADYGADDVARVSQAETHAITNGGDPVRSWWLDGGVCCWQWARPICDVVAVCSYSEVQCS